MVITILCYSVFSGLTAFATELWHVAALRFLVAMGVGGEWAVAAALVAEVFPTRARAHASGIFHATSVVGTWLAAIAGLLIGVNWRLGYLVSVIPALLVLWVRVSVKEPERSLAARFERAGKSQMPLKASPSSESTRRVAGHGPMATAGDSGNAAGDRRAGIVLGSDRRGAEPRAGNAGEVRRRQGNRRPEGEVRLWHRGDGRRRFGTLVLRPVGGADRPAGGVRRVSSGVADRGAVVCYLPQNYDQLLMALPVYGFVTLGIHAGYAVYFPELFPDRLRATGTGVCFNGGRLASALFLVLSAQLKALPDMDVRWAVTLLSLIFVPGLVLLPFLPETKGQPLPE